MREMHRGEPQILHLLHWLETEGGVLVGILWETLTDRYQFRRNSQKKLLREFLRKYVMHCLRD